MERRLTDIDNMFTGKLKPLCLNCASKKSIHTGASKIQVSLILPSMTLRYSVKFLNL